MDRWASGTLALGLLWCAVCPVFGQPPNVGQDKTAAPTKKIAPGVAHLPADVKRVLGWLPEDTESILVTRGPLGEAAKKRLSNATGFQKPSKPNFAQLQLVYSTWMFPHAGSAFLDNFVKQKIRYVVAAGRRFGPPIIGGMAPFEGCQLVVFDNQVPDVAIRSNDGSPVHAVQIENQRVARIDLPWGGLENKRPIYYAKPRPDLLIAASNAAFLRTLLQRMTKRLKSQTPLFDFPEWNVVDTLSPSWGIRHRRTATPFTFVFKSTPGFVEAMPKLDGIAFSYQAKPTLAVRQYFHCTDNPENVVPNIFGKGYEIKCLGPHMAEGNIPLVESDDPKSPQSGTPDGVVFMVQHLMGYVICP